MIIYIAGPISGLPNRNGKEFANAKREIAAIFKMIQNPSKVKIINPVRLGYMLDNQFAKNGKGEPAWQDYMKACIKELSQSDFVYLLKDWGNSPGAVTEKYLAEKLKIPCAENITDLTALIIKRYNK